MQSVSIKNLCIALEALSRIPGSEPERLGFRIHQLLDEVLTKEEEQVRREKENIVPPAYKPNPSASDTENEIPF